MDYGIKGEDIMDILRVMEQRHSVRQYKDIAIESEKRDILNNFANELSAKSGLNIKIIYDDEKGFDSKMAHYGHFQNVRNYIALFGKHSFWGKPLPGWTSI
ncbi:MAG: hypothetical protein J6Y43_06320, partial [Clostridia bacterium]|nr:hypothetical protein [Clostridia bacterium]